MQMTNKGFEDNVNTIICGNVVDVQEKLPKAVFNCCITSPPYWGLRAYQTTPVVWGGDKNCRHEWQGKVGAATDNTTHKGKGCKGFRSDRYLNQPQFQPTMQFCSKCNAWRGELGLEPTPELYIEHLMTVFDGVKRVLRKDGVLFVNIGDTYGGSGMGVSYAGQTKGPQSILRDDLTYMPDVGHTRGKYDKTLMAIPERFVLAMMQHGWIRRCTIIWAKGLSFCDTYSGSCMPDSCKDRPNKNGMEYLFMFVKAKETKTDIPVRLAKTISKEEAAWLASFIDSEGCFHIAPRKNKENYEVRISAVNRDIKMLNRCREITGIGSVGVRNHGEKPLYHWQVHAQNAISVIAEIYPYLISKREQAKVMITYQKCVHKLSGGHKLNDKEKNERQQLYELIKSLNQRELSTSGLPEPNLNRFSGCEKYFYEQVFEEAQELNAERPRMGQGNQTICNQKRNEVKNLRAREKPHTMHVLRTEGIDQRQFNPLGRTIRNVWTINPQAFSEAHFATFPEKLVEICLKLGCPEFVCKRCGLPRRRIYEKSGGTTGKSWHPHNDDIGQGNVKQQTGSEFATYKNIELGLTDCGCGAGFRAGIAFDPFMGSGTVALGAYKNRRDYCGIELSEEYVRMAETRLDEARQQYSLLEPNKEA